MTRWMVSLWLVSSVWVASGAAQAPLGASPHAALPAVAGKPANLKVLPQEMSLQDVRARMTEMTRGLGVECTFCHEQNPETRQTDFASDANPTKETARNMMRMTRDINERYLSLLGDRRYVPPFTCGNCHRGQAQPPEFDGKGAP